MTCENKERAQSQLLQVPDCLKHNSCGSHLDVSTVRAGMKRSSSSEEECSSTKRQYQEKGGSIPKRSGGTCVHLLQPSAVHPGLTLEHADLVPLGQPRQPYKTPALAYSSSVSPNQTDLPNIPADVITGMWPSIATSSRNSCFEPSYSSKQQPTSMLCGMDGANDEMDLLQPSITISRTASVSDLKAPPVRPFRPSVVHFLSDEHLSWREAARRKDRDGFTNPFDSDDTALRRSSTASEGTAYLRPNAFSGHRDTLARLVYFAKDDDDEQTAADSDGDSFTTAWTRQPSISTPSRRYSLAGGNLDIFLPESVVDSVLGLLSFEDYKILRLVCRQWHLSLPQPHLPGAYRLPREILKHLFSYLAPWDFDAARHTCKAWLLASLDRKLLEPMLRDSGCQSGSTADIERLQGNMVAKRRSWDNYLGPMTADADHVIDKEWLCSKRLATETRLSPFWTGGSLADDSDSRRLTIIEKIDFSKVLTAATKSKFTVSACGKYVLLVSGGDITVYNLSDPDRSLAPVVRLATGIEVVEVSMDTSSERYSVAALLAGRIGMLWDLRGHHIQKRYRSNSGEPMSLGMQTHIQSSASFQHFRPSGVSSPIRSPAPVTIEDSDLALGPATLLDNSSPPSALSSAPFL